MASQSSPPADPLQLRNSKGDNSRQAVISTTIIPTATTTTTTATSLLSTTTIPTTTLSTTTTTASTESSKNCKLYELIATSDDDSELKKLFEETDNLAVCGSSTGLKVPEFVRTTNDISSNYLSVLQNSALRNKCERKKRDVDSCEALNDSHFHPYAKMTSQRPVIHRPLVKSCTDLRSTAPVLYDLLNDDCDSENHDRSSNISRNTLPDPNYNSSLDSNNLLRPLTVQMPFVSSPGLPTISTINQLPASYISTFLQQNLLQSYPSVSLLKPTQAPNYLEDLPSVTPILPSVLRDVLAFDDDTKKVRYIFYIYFF